MTTIEYLLAALRWADRIDGTPRTSEAFEQGADAVETETGFAGARGGEGGRRVRVLLVRPPVTIRERRRWYPAEPLALLCLATYVRGAMPDAEVRILDCLNGGPEDCTRVDGGWMVAQGRIGAGRAETPRSPDEAQAGTDRLSVRALERARNVAQRAYPFFHALRLLNPFYLLGEFLPKLLGGRLGYAREVARVWLDLTGLSRVARALQRRAT